MYNITSHEHLQIFLSGCHSLNKWPGNNAPCCPLWYLLNLCWVFFSTGNLIDMNWLKVFGLSKIKSSWFKAHWCSESTQIMFVQFVWPDLVNKVEGYGSLACAHLFRLEVLLVLGSDGIHTCLQLTSHLILFPILLTLQEI